MSRIRPAPKKAPMPKRMRFLCIMNVMILGAFWASAFMDVHVLVVISLAGLHGAFLGLLLLLLFRSRVFLNRARELLSESDRELELARVARERGDAWSLKIHLQKSARLGQSAMRFANLAKRVMEGAE